MTNRVIEVIRRAGGAASAAASAVRAETAALNADTDALAAAASASAAAASALSVDAANLLTKTGNLAGLSSPAAARTNLGATATGSSVFTAADAAAARSAIGAPPTPQGGTGGPGQNYAIQTVSGGVLTLPAGGTWQWNALAFNSSTGAYLSAAAGTNIGGNAIAGPNANVTHLAFVWRLS